MKIYKQRLRIVPEQFVDLPLYSSESGSIKILKLEMQNNEPCVWFVTDCQNSKRVRFNFYMTGEDITEDFDASEYLGTCLLTNGIVLHAFMKIIDK